MSRWWAIAMLGVLAGGAARAEDVCSIGRWHVDLREWRAFAPSCVVPPPSDTPDAGPQESAAPGAVRWMLATPRAIVTDTVVRDGSGALVAELRATTEAGDALWTVRLPVGASLPVLSGGRLYVLEPENGSIRLVERALDSGAPLRRLSLEDVSAAGLPDAVLREDAPGLLELTAALGRCG